MSRQLSPPQATLLGLLIVATLALGGSAFMFLNDRSGFGGGSIRVVAGFADVQGVEVGARVRIQGMDAGEIEAIHPPENPGDKVRLQLRIGAKFRHLVREDAKVQIASDNLFAGKIVRILPGSTDARLLDDQGELQADVQPDTLDQVAQAAVKLNRLLSDVEGAMQSFRASGSAVTEDLAQATRKLNTVLTKADAALDGIDKGHGTLGKLVKDETLYMELTETLAQVKSAMHDVRSGEGTLGKLVKTNEAYGEAMTSLREVRRMVNSVKQNSDAIKSLPVVRSYVVDPAKELVRPDCTRVRKWYAEKDLFEPGKAVLTADGKRALDEGGAWLNEQKYPGADVLIAAFAEPTQNGDFAAAVTKKQSEVVMEYLRSQHAVHRTGWWWWSTRPVRSIGCGNAESPVPEREKMPGARIELLVFVPQK